MQKKIVAWSKEIPCQRTDNPPNPLIAAIDFVYLLSNNLECNPMLYSSADNALWIYYPNSVIVCEDFFEEYGAFMADSHSAVYGGADGFEGGALTAERINRGKTLHSTKLNVSGTDFELLRDISLKITLESEKHIKEYKNIISGINWRSAYLAIERTEFVENIFSNVSQKRKDTYYRYIGIDAHGSYLSALSIEQLKKLWLIYFEDGFSPLEFDDAFSAMVENEISVFPWQLALRLALEEKGITVSYDNGYCIIDQNDSRITPSFESRNSAEKLFIKLLFPKRSL